jgi:hypothetical protein
MSLKSKKVKNMHGGEYMPLYTDTSKDWANAGTVPNLAVNLDAGINEYVFGRTTPDNRFIVSTGLTLKPYGVEMVGGAKKKSNELKKKIEKIKKIENESKELNKLKKKLIEKQKKIEKENKELKNLEKKILEKEKEYLKKMEKMEKESSKDLKNILDKKLDKKM